MAETVLTTDRLELRAIDEGHLDAHLEHLNTPAVMARLGGPRSREAIAEKHAASRASFAKEGFGFMLVYERDTGELVAHCGLKRVSNPLAPNVGTHEIGWLVREDRWRMGYAEEAVRALINWAFDTHGAPHLVALTSESNIGSWKLMEKLGMERRTDLDFDDPFFSDEDNPTIQYGLTRERWENE
ncbi:MAG: GNAT family N-acetyltransferase [Pseudomonadota bacterium]